MAILTDLSNYHKPETFIGLQKEKGTEKENAGNGDLSIKKITCDFDTKVVDIKNKLRKDLTEIIVKNIGKELHKEIMWNLFKEFYPFIVAWILWIVFLLIMSFVW